MGSFASLLVAAFLVWAVVLVVSVLGFVPARPDQAGHAWVFLPYLPGVSITLLAGSAGAFLDGLLELNRMSPTHRA
jgi:hypothetical protein